MPRGRFLQRVQGFLGLARGALEAGIRNQPVLLGAQPLVPLLAVQGELGGERVEEELLGHAVERPVAVDLDQPVELGALLDGLRLARARKIEVVFVLEHGEQVLHLLDVRLETRFAHHSLRLGLRTLH